MTELKELYKNILTSFDVESIAGLSKQMMDFMLANKTDAFEKYIPLCPDFETDYLQKMWQFFEADREEKKQDYTPACLGELLSALIGDAETVYDCCAGSGSLTIQKWLHDKNTRFVCEELDGDVIPFLLFNLAVRNIEGYVVNGNALTRERFAVFKLEKGERYSRVKEVAAMELDADCGISNPPYNIPWIPGGELFDERFSESGLPPKNNANFAFVLSVLNKVKKKAAFILPMGSLSSPEEKSIRKYLVDKGLMEAVVALPDDMFESTGISVCVISLDKTRKHEKIVFIDHRNIYETDIREQRGEGEVHYQRVYKKEVKIITLEQIGKIAETIREERQGLEFSGIISAIEIKEKEYNLLPGRYVERVKRSSQHRPFEDIANDINRCIREKNTVKLTINETIARSMGLNTIADLMREGNKITDTMNGQGLWKQWGFEFEKEAYITLTKNRSEIRIAQIDKEAISHLLLLLLPQFEQHIYYLNMRENEYLAELRDALLPGLMDGTIKIEPERKCHGIKKSVQKT
jgi:type I restriction-modification system DNA methylase subunit